MGMPDCAHASHSSGRHVQRRYLTRGRPSQEREARTSYEKKKPDDVTAHKRKSFEAGLREGFERGVRRSVDKIGKLSTDQSAQVSDFYPSELQERSLLFNSQYTPSS